MSVTGFIDAHCHLNDEGWIARAREAQVVRAMIGGVDPDDWQRQRKLKDLHPDWIRTSFGLHPWTVELSDRSQMQRALDQLAAVAGEADAIGETGLDYHSKRDPAKFELQLEAFRSQIRIAQDLGKPLVLHVVRAHGVSIREIDVSGFRGPMLVHSYSGSVEEAREWIKRGAMLSFSGRFLIPCKYERTRKVLQWVPVEHLLLETDGINEPACISDLYREVATLRGWELEFLTQKLDENFRNFG